MLVVGLDGMYPYGIVQVGRGVTFIIISQW